VLGRSPGQAQANTGEVGVGVGVGRASVTGRGVVRPAASALASLHAARTGMGWLGCTASAEPREIRTDQKRNLEILFSTPLLFPR
jgi:hypothetical protein